MMPKVSHEEENIGKRFSSALLGFAFVFGALWFESLLGFIIAIALGLIAILPENKIWANKTALFSSVVFIGSASVLKINEVVSLWVDLYLKYPERFSSSAKIVDTSSKVVQLIFFVSFGIYLIRWRRSDNITIVFL